MDGTSNPGERPNVLILMADQFRSDIVGANGSPICRTPSLDGLAADGVGFDRAYTTTPLCTPARAALFTGRFAHSNGLTANTHYPESPTPRLPPSERLVFQHLAAAGYRCGYVGKWHLSLKQDDTGGEAGEAHRRGVTDFSNSPASARWNRERLELPPRDDVLSPARERIMVGDHPPMSGVLPYSEDYHPDVANAALAATLLGNYREQGLGDAERPFALVCSFQGPHHPTEVPEPYASMYSPEAVPKPESFDDDFVGKPQGQRTHRWMQLGAHLSWPEWQRLTAHYWGFATFIDALMGRVLDALDATGVADRTVVLATADHGDMTGHHRLFDKGPYFYDEVMRVPFVWRYPGKITARVRLDDALVSLVDVVPTLLDLAGVTPEPGSPPLQGRSLAARLCDGGGSGNETIAPPDRQDAVFGETSEGDLISLQVDARMVRTERWKYVYRPNDLDELYDVGTDPENMRNLASDPRHANDLRAMRARLAAWMRETEDTLPPPAT